MTTETDTEPEKFQFSRMLPLIYREDTIQHVPHPNIFVIAKDSQTI